MSKGGGIVGVVEEKNLGEEKEMIHELKNLRGEEVYAQRGVEDGDKVQDIFMKGDILSHMREIDTITVLCA